MKPMKPIHKLRRLWILLAFPVSFALTVLAARMNSFAEWYAGTVYPAISLAINHMTSHAKFSVGEIFVYFLIIFLIISIVRLIMRIIRGKGRRGYTTGKFFVNILCATGVLLMLFTVDCGINYYRVPFSQSCGLTVKPSKKSELVQLCKSLAGDSNTLRKKVSADRLSVMKLHMGSFSQNAEEARKCMDSLSRQYHMLSPGYSAPKPVLASKLMSECNITGMFFPYTFEANVNTDVPDYTIPFTMCHELSHLRGFMREDEANFIAYLACEDSSDADFRYSGAASAFTYASNALYSADATKANVVFSGLSSGVKKDLQANTDYWNNFKGPAAKASNSVNNRYLKANNQSDGVQSYGRMVDLLLALQRSKKSTK